MLNRFEVRRGCTVPSTLTWPFTKKSDGTEEYIHIYVCVCARMCICKIKHNYHQLTTEEHRRVESFAYNFHV